MHMLTFHIGGQLLQLCVYLIGGIVHAAVGLLVLVISNLKPEPDCRLRLLDLGMYTQRMMQNFPSFQPTAPAGPPPPQLTTCPKPQMDLLLPQQQHIHQFQFLPHLHHLHRLQGPLHCQQDQTPPQYPQHASPTPPVPYICSSSYWIRQATTLLTLQQFIKSLIAVDIDT